MSPSHSYYRFSDAACGRAPQTRTLGAFDHHRSAAGWVTAKCVIWSAITVQVRRRTVGLEGKQAWASYDSTHKGETFYYNGSFLVTIRAFRENYAWFAIYCLVSSSPSFPKIRICFVITRFKLLFSLLVSWT